VSNALIDLAAERATGGKQRADLDGRIAARGKVDEELLDRLMADAFFNREPPRSTGRERFGHALMERVAAAVAPQDDQAWADLLATLTAFTARSIGDSYRRWVIPRGVDEVIVTGGGAKNPSLMAAIRAEIAPVPIVDESALGMSPDAREAAAFAVLAWAHLLGAPANVPEATGAEGPRVLGSFTPGRVGGTS
jgi:anhydro-N-acetylmuramic acid kinase